MESDDFGVYLDRHNQAVAWAVLNRQIIAKRFLGALGLKGSCKLDLCHNSVTPFETAWLHRKGAAPADQGPVVIPGSRGTLSYLVAPKPENQGALLSSPTGQAENGNAQMLNLACHIATVW